MLLLEECLLLTFSATCCHWVFCLFFSLFFFFLVTYIYWLPCLQIIWKLTDFVSVGSYAGACENYWELIERNRANTESVVSLDNSRGQRNRVNTESVATLDAKLGQKFFQEDWSKSLLVSFDIYEQIAKRGGCSGFLTCIWTSSLLGSFYYLCSDSALNSQMKPMPLMQKNKEIKCYGPSPAFQIGRWDIEKEGKGKGGWESSIVFVNVWGTETRKMK